MVRTVLGIYCLINLQIVIAPRTFDVPKTFDKIAPLSWFHNGRLSFLPENTQNILNGKYKKKRFIKAYYTILVWLGCSCFHKCQGHLYLKRCAKFAKYLKNYSFFTTQIFQVLDSCPTKNH